MATQCAVSVGAFGQPGPARAHSTACHVPTEVTGAGERGRLSKKRAPTGSLLFLDHSPAKGTRSPWRQLSEHRTRPHGTPCVKSSTRLRPPPHNQTPAATVADRKLFTENAGQHGVGEGAQDWKPTSTTLKSSSLQEVASGETSQPQSIL